MPNSPNIPIQKESTQTQLQRLQELLDRNRTTNTDLWAGYQYIRANIAGNPAWDQDLLDWLDTAVSINGPGSSFMKQFVFGMNDEAAFNYQRRHISWTDNQRVSDNLARQVISDYMNALRTGQTLTPQQIFVADVGSAVRGLGLPPYAWAGGLFGGSFGFDLSYIYPDLDTAFRRGQEWLVNADTVTGRILANDPTAAASEAIARSLKALRKRFLGINLYTDERLDALSPGADGFASIPGLVNATYLYFKTSIPQQYSVQVENDDGSPTGPTTYNVFYRVGPTFELQISTPRGMSTLTSNDWTASGDEANFLLSGGGTMASVRTSAQGGAAAQRVVSASVNGQDITSNVAIATNLAGILGNSLTRFVAGSNPLAQVATGTIIQAVGLNLAQAIAQGGIVRDITFQLESGATQTVRNNVLSNFGSEVATAFGSAAIGSFSALLTAELGSSLGLKGFGAELFNTVAGTGANAVISQVASNIGKVGADLFEGIALDRVFAGGVPDVLSGALGSFFGAKLGSLVISPTNTEGAILSSVGSAAGGWATSVAGAKLLGGAFQIVSKLGFFGGPLVGAFVGFVLGAFIGKLFGRKKPRVPTANAAVNLDLATGFFTLGATSSSNGGNQTFVVDMATSARDILNSLVGAVVGGQDIAASSGAGGATPSQAYGHTGGQVWVNYAHQGQLNVADAAAAVEYGIIRAVHDTRIRGGDIFVKRALLASPAQSAVTLTGDIQIAADYRTYLTNRSSINQIIQAAPTSSFTATWATVLARAAELGLHKFQISDFHGGLAGFASSFALGVKGTVDVPLEAIDFSWENGPVRVAVRPGTTTAHRTSDVDGVPAQIWRLYDMALGRPPSSDEIREWLSIMEQRNVELNGAAALILTDPGVNSRFGPMSNDDFIRSMYQASLHRQPSAEEVAVWRPNVTNNGRGWVLAWFSEYAEHRAFTDPVIAQGINYSKYTGKGLFSLLPTASADGRSVVIPNLADIGYRPVDPSTAPMSEGNDYIDWRWPWAGGLNLDAQGGDDIITASHNTDLLWGSAGSDWLDGREGHDQLWGGAQDDVLIGGSGVDRLFGDGDSDYLSGGDGNDYVQEWTSGPAPGGLYGGAGNDILVGNGGQDALFGEDGDDTLIVDQDNGAFYDHFDGGTGTDVVSFERFSSGVHVDMWTGAGGIYTTHTYGDGWVQVEGLVGSAQDDVLYAHDGNSVVKGGAGNDLMAGRPGDDVLEGGAGADRIYGDAGNDTASYEGSSSGVIVDLATGTALGGDASGDYLNTIENLRGSKFADELTGDAGNNMIEGLAGDDVVVASGGNDYVIGGAGFDIFDASSATTAVSMDSNIQVHVNGGYSTLAGMEGFIGSAFDDFVIGASADEFFDGAAGNDYLGGAAGSDIYRLGRVYGVDQVGETNDGANDIQVGDGLRFRDIEIWGAGGTGNLVIHSRFDSSQLVVNGNWSYAADGNHNHKIKSITFEGGSTVDVDGIDWSPDGANSMNSTTIFGRQDKADVVFAFAGDDTVLAAGSSYAHEQRGNLVYAGQGNDAVYTSSGDDQILFERGDGRDYLSDTGGADTIVMGPDVAADDVIFEIVQTSYDAEAGSGYSDLYIGIRDAANPELRASQVADHIKILNGGTINENVSTDGQKANTVEFVRVAGQEIDLTKLNLPFTRIYYSGYGDRYDDGTFKPIAIDLDGDGIEMRSVEGSRILTTDAEGGLWRTGWVGPDDGFLALDRNGDGVIDRLGEISFVQDLEGAKTDLEGLAAQDTNADGKFDAADARFGEFKVWRDRNQDGVGVTSELMNLTEAGIVSVSLKGQETGFTAADGIDNVVFASTEIGWTDAARVGRGYDVGLAVQQVRTDGGHEAKADKLSKIDKSGYVDQLDASLIGIQALTEGQIAATKDKKAKREKEPKDQNDDVGLFGRAETMLQGATVGADGLFQVDPTKVKRLPKVDKAGKPIDPYIDSAWTKLGSQQPGDLDRSGADVEFVERVLTQAEVAGFKEAKKNFDDKQAADAAKEAARIEKEKVDAASAPTPGIPTAEEMERRAKDDTFRLLQPPATSNADAVPDLDAQQVVQETATQATEPQAHTMQGDVTALTALSPDQEAEVGDGGPDQHVDTPMRQPALGAATGTAASRPVGSVAEPEIAETSPEPVEPTGSPDDAESTSASPGDRPTASSGSVAQAADDGSRAAADQDTSYAVVIQAANARLVQALASFGNAPAMMASYQGLNTADDAQAAWMSVDAMPSVRRFASVS